MDEFLYLVALAVGIVGGVMLWWYSRSKKRAVTKAIEKQEGNQERE
jgi:hypothetical protein